MKDEEKKPIMSSSYKSPITAEFIKQLFATEKSLQNCSTWLKQQFDTPWGRIQLVIDMLVIVRNQWNNLLGFFSLEKMQIFFIILVDSMNQDFTIIKTDKNKDHGELSRVATLFVEHIESIISIEFFKALKKNLKQIPKTCALDVFLNTTWQILQEDSTTENIYLFDLPQLFSLLMEFHDHQLLSTENLAAAFMNAGRLATIGFMAEDQVISIKPLELRLQALGVEKVSSSAASQYLYGFGALAKLNRLKSSLSAETALLLLSVISGKDSECHTENTLPTAIAALLNLIRYQGISDFSSLDHKILHRVLAKTLRKFSEQEEKVTDGNALKLSMMMVNIAEICSLLNEFCTNPFQMASAELIVPLRTTLLAHKNNSWPANAARILLSVGQILHAGGCGIKDKKDIKMKLFEVVSVLSDKALLPVIPMRDIAYTLYGLALSGFARDPQKYPSTLLEEFQKNLKGQTAHSVNWQTLHHCYQIAEYLCFSGLCGIRLPEWIFPFIEIRRAELRTNQLQRQLKAELPQEDWFQDYECETEELIGAWFLDLTIKSKVTGEIINYEFDKTKDHIKNNKLRVQDVARDDCLQRLVDPAVNRPVVISIKRISVDPPIPSVEQVKLIIKAHLLQLSQPMTPLVSTPSLPAKSESTPLSSELKTASQLRPPLRIKKPATRARRKKPPRTKSGPSFLEMPVSIEKKLVEQQPVAKISPDLKDPSYQAKVLENLKKLIRPRRCKCCLIVKTIMMENLLRLARKGDVHSQFELVLRHMNLTPVNVPAILYWLHAASSQDHAEAQTILAKLYFHGYGVEQNQAEAIRLIAAAARQNYAPAQILLGEAYEQGSGLVVNQKEALRLYRAAAKKGHGVGQYKLAQIYNEGTLVRANPEAAFKLWVAAADKQYEPAYAQVGRCYLRGYGTPKDKTEGLRRLQSCVAKGDGQALYILGEYFISEDDEKQATSYIKQAAEKNHANAQVLLANMYQRGIGVAKNDKESFRLQKAAADQNHHGALYMLACSYYEGCGVTKDDAKALIYCRKSAQLGYEDAKTLLKIISPQASSEETVTQLLQATGSLVFSRVNPTQQVNIRKGSTPSTKLIP